MICEIFIEFCFWFELILGLIIVCSCVVCVGFVFGFDVLFSCKLFFFLEEIFVFKLLFCVGGGGVFFVIGGCFLWIVFCLWWLFSDVGWIGGFGFE